MIDNIKTPEEWSIALYGDIYLSASNGIGGTQNKAGVGIPVSRIETIAEQKIDYTRVGYLSSFDNEKIKKHKLQKGDILFSHINSPVHLGKTAIYDGVEKLYHGINLLRIIVNKDIFSPRLFNYHCKYTRALGLFSLNAQHAINQSSLNQKKLSAFKIPLPPLAEQKEIADRLDALMAQVEVTQSHLARIPDIIKRFRQSVLAAAVSGKLTEEWRTQNTKKPWLEGVLGDFIHKPTYGSSAKSKKNGLVPVLRMGNLQNGKLDWSDLVYTSDEIEIEKYKLTTGDILFNRTNSPELVGKTSIYRSEKVAIYAGYLIKISCLPVLNPEFLNYHLNSPSARAYCYAVKSDGVSQSNINAKKLAEYPIALPQLTEQTEIVRRVEQLFAYADTIELQTKVAKERVDNLTQAILAKAFRGELTADWRAANPDLIRGDNSAKTLLKHIKTERKTR